MCKLLLGVNSGNDPEFGEIVKAQFISLENQKDGCAGLVITKDKKCHIFRELKDYGKVFEAVEKLLPNARLVSLHTRISTGGITTLKNVHYFEKDGWVMAHNGWITKLHPRQVRLEWGGIGYRYYDDNQIDDCEECKAAPSGRCAEHRPKGRKENDECDSLQFLNKIKKPITKKGLEKFMKEMDFFGMAVLIEKATGKCFVAVKKQVKAFKGNDFMVLFSYEPTKRITKFDFIDAFGVVMTEEEKRKIELQEREVAEGVFEIKL
jgi:hypothetical protein